MRITSPTPKSSFLSVEKDINLIINKMLNDERLKRLLYYNTPDCLDKENLTEKETYHLIGRNIKNVPKLKIDSDILNYVIINFDSFKPSGNPEFRDNVVIFDIICHFDQWSLNDMQLRPYKIAGEIDSLFNNEHLSGIGTLKFVSANQIVLNDELGGIALCYQAVHGGEDKKFMQTEKQEIQFIKDFEDMVRK